MERIRVLGEPLTEEEVAELVEKYRHNDCGRQINIGTFFFLSLCSSVHVISEYDRSCLRHY